MAANDLGVELADHASEEDHGDSRNEEDVDDPVGHAPEFDAVAIAAVGGSAELDDEYDQNDHELTAEEVSVEVVSLVDELHAPVGHGVALTVKFGVDGAKANEGSLPTLDHGQPDDGEQHDDEGEDWARLERETRLPVEHVANDENDAEDQQKGGVQVLEHPASAIDLDSGLDIGLDIGHDCCFVDIGCSYEESKKANVVS